ncbi:hypothetical protein QQS21_009540 [Conoideocrella luteorostrata]|uniref:Amino acid permease/ SLC12A domain-containing protein n=1 Tax=Conoideocrella luteorostrata TaxID=1105319 RepID=A0AAJ0FVJ9_9HYPO|nr:hypothetical protein QQS21_009540 [Conoideocrella luteorostrata]
MESSSSALWRERTAIEDSNNHLHRRLGNREIQLIAIGGSIGTGLFINIGLGLVKAGPASTFIAFTIYCCFIALVNNCMAEMAILLPVSGGFIRMAGKWVDDALGFMAGCNFFLYEATLIPYEVAALNVVLSFWRNDIHPAVTITLTIAIYGVLNVLAVRFYGESEFWLSSGKVILVLLFFGFTFFAMVGANPKRDAYGFRYWSNPGPFAEWHTKNDLGRFEGFLNALWAASFVVVGPEYLSMTAGEAKLPRTYMKSAFKTTYWRFGLFFIGGALCCGIVIPYNDPKLQGLISETPDGSGTAAASPYVIAMRNMGIGVMPHIANALIFTSIFSAGNTYTYCAIQSLHGMALEGRAPKILARTTKSGIPIYCFGITMLFPFLSYLQLSNGSMQVLQWFINLVTAGCVINFIVICITYIFFCRACQAQDVDRRTFPYCGYFQPYSTWLGLFWVSFVLIFYGYASFTPWAVGTFFLYYAMAFAAIIAFAGWKIVKGTKIVPAAEADLIWERPAIDAYEEACEEFPSGFWSEVLGLLGWKKLRNSFTRKAA